MIRRSVPISSMNFVEIKFYYSGSTGKRTPPHVKQSVRKITSGLTMTLFKIGSSYAKASEDRSS